MPSCPICKHAGFRQIESWYLPYFKCDVCKTEWVSGPDGMPYIERIQNKGQIQEIITGDGFRRYSKV